MPFWILFVGWCKCRIFSFACGSLSEWERRGISYLGSRTSCSFPLYFERWLFLNWQTTRFLHTTSAICWYFCLSQASTCIIQSSDSAIWKPSPFPVCDSWQDVGVDDCCSMKRALTPYCSNNLVKMTQELKTLLTGLRLSKYGTYRYVLIYVDDSS